MTETQIYHVTLHQDLERQGIKTDNGNGANIGRGGIR